MFREMQLRECITDNGEWRKIETLNMLEKECDYQEFAGSMMFDEYPDKMGILRIVNRIFENIKKEEASCNGKECIKYPDDQWLKDIIMVLLLNEIYRRRQKRKRYY